MSKWDDGNLEEARLLKKFEDYLELEKKELDKRNNHEKLASEKFGSWQTRFIFLTIFQGTVISGLIISFLFVDFDSDTKIMSLLITLGVLGAEIIFLTNYLRRTKIYTKKFFVKQDIKSEFDFI